MSSSRKVRRNRVLHPVSTPKQAAGSPDETLSQQNPNLSPEEKAKVKAVQSNFAGLVVALRAINAQTQALSSNQVNDAIILATLVEIDESIGKFTDAMYAIRAVVEESLKTAGA